MAGFATTLALDRLVDSGHRPRRVWVAGRRNRSLRNTAFDRGDGGAILAIVTGVTVLGAITGGTMVWLLRQRKNNKEKQDSPTRTSKNLQPTPLNAGR